MRYPQPAGHQCAAVHASGEEFAACAWPSAKVSGAGAYAVLARCAGVRLHAERWPVARVVLCAELVAAQQSARHFDNFGCGLAFCTGDHQPVWLTVGEGG